MRRIVTGVLILHLAGCGASVKPLTQENAGFGQSASEQQLLSESRLEHADLRKRGLLLSDPEILGYIESVARPLIPATAARKVNFRFHVLRAPFVNAFAMPTGDIYLSVGLLARIENEAELAMVLAHEISHVVDRHAFERYESQRSGLIAAHIADLLLFGTSLAYLPYMSSMASFSREHETEADGGAIEILQATPYDLAAAAQLFTRLSEVKKGEELAGSAYGTHPDNMSRLTAAKARIAALNPAPGKVGALEYAVVRGRLLFENIRLKLNERQYELALEAADLAVAAFPENPEAYYLRGECARRAGTDPAGAAREHAWLYDESNDDALIARMASRRDDLYEKATRDFDAATRLSPAYAMPLRGKGLLAAAQGDPTAARFNLEAYLSAEPKAKDRLYIQNIIKGMKP